MAAYALSPHPGHEQEQGLQACQAEGTNQTERARYFYGMLLEARDLDLDQGFHMEARRRHNAELHGHGTVCGLQVTDLRCKWEIEVEPGVAADCLGRSIRVERPVRLDLQEIAAQAFRERTHRGNRDSGLEEGDSRYADPEDRDCWGDPIDLWISICYAETPERAVQALGAPDTCCEPACENSRVRHGYCITVSDEEPERPGDVLEGLDCGRDRIRQHLCDWITKECRACEVDPCGEEHHCVTLAHVRVRHDGEVLRPDNCKYRSLVVPTSVLTEILMTLHEEWKR